MQGQGRPSPGGAPSPSFCIPADGVHCRGCRWDPDNGICTRPDCSALFTPPAVREQQRSWPHDEQPQLVIAAGPERSGSTFLYNALRLLWQHARKPCDAYYLKCITDSALDERGAGQPGAPHVLVKMHAWSEHWDVNRAAHIFVTHRDVAQVLASYRRLGWAWELPDDYVRDHLIWQRHAELDVAFEDIAAHPLWVLEQLASRLGLQEVDCAAVLRDLDSLPVPQHWVDPVTQLWPAHISPAFRETRAAAEAAAAAAAGGGQVPSKEAAGDAAPAGGSSDRPRAARNSGGGKLSAAEVEQLQKHSPEFYGLYPQYLQPA